MAPWGAIPSPALGVPWPGARAAAAWGDDDEMAPVGRVFPLNGQAYWAEALMIASAVEIYKERQYYPSEDT